MTSDEAKTYLHAWRDGNPDPVDPLMAEALAQTRRDPELLAWFQMQRNLDATIVDRLQEISPPPGLAEQIVAAHRARRHRYVRALTMAALLAILCTLGALLFGNFQPPPTEYGALQSDMAEFLVSFPRLDLATDRWTAISDWLTTKSGFSSARLPAGLQRFPGLGCREIEWRGKRLMLVCFAAEGQIVHLFVVRQGDLSGTPDNSRPQLSRVKGWTAAGWTDDGVTWLALTRGNQTFLKNLLRTTTG